MNIERLFELAGLPNNDLLLEAPMYDNMVTALKSKYPDKVSFIDENIKQAKKVLTAPDKDAPSSDKMVWYIKVLRAYLYNKLNDVKGNYNFTSIEQFNNDFFHYYGFNIPQIFNTELINQNISELFDTFNDYVNKYQKSDKPPVPVKKGDYELIKCNDGTSWWFVDRAYCEEEGRSGKHCGNIVGKTKTEQRILSLRTPNHNVILTFILLKNGYLGEMKAKANLKPSEKYHPQIMQLLLNPIVKGIKGAGYAPYMNFSIFDLSEHNINVLINHGKQSFISDQIISEPIEFLKAPDYIKNNKKYQQVAIKSLPALQYLIGKENDLRAWEEARFHDPALIIYAPHELSNFKTNVMLWLQLKPSDLLKAPKSVSHDFDILKDILEYEYNGNSIRYVMPTTPRYNELCKIAVTHSVDALEDISEDFITLDLCKIAVSKYGKSLEYVPEKFKNKEICTIAVEGNSEIIRFVPEHLRTYELCKFAVDDDAYNISFVPTNIEHYEELCKIAVTKNSTNLKNIDKKFRTYELCNIALHNSRSLNLAYTLSLVPDTVDNYEELCDYAIQKFDNTNKDYILQYIHNDDIRQRLMQKYNIQESVDFKYFQTL
jgi:hypothetical protein